MVPEPIRCDKCATVVVVGESGNLIRTVCAAGCCLYLRCPTCRTPWVEMGPVSPGCRVCGRGVYDGITRIRSMYRQRHRNRRP